MAKLKARGTEAFVLVVPVVLWFKRPPGAHGSIGRRLERRALEGRGPHQDADAAARDLRLRAGQAQGDGDSEGNEGDEVDLLFFWYVFLF